MSDSSLPLIAVDALKVGTFIHLDLGWMAHPFPLGSFRIASQGQIDTLRRLGLRSVRWCPERSAQPEPPAPPPVSAAAETPEQARQREQRAALAAQRAALRQCERQFAETVRALRAATELSASDPLRAGESTTALARELVPKLLGARELNIRLLAESAGERSATHAVNVALIALLMGRNFGLPEAELVELGVGAMLHDVGKLDLPSRLRWRDDGFNGVELERWREHVELGVERARAMGLGDTVLTIVAQHHEQADGSGFPQRLNVDRMSAAARIVALVDRFDSLCNPLRPGDALTPHEALSQMFAKSQHQFDTTMLSAFIRMMGIYPPGSAVQLTDGRYALVVSVNSTRPLKPWLQVYDAAASDEDESPLLDLQQMPGLGIRRSLKPMELPRPVLRQLAPRSRLSFGFEAVDDRATP